eukprot:CAMPEP_0178707070 /NCGR_PEP_ID=MMETSP0699-20121125/15792_1 /TAXON_ID=265572 /ORGANISM="Extubocellulus spinifer, Strain CCMP396" /LENGTH=394 /DNA_ID=CAMNT_0020355009 /DNA_START=177 /DNA_END=1361 /DNA_ORIENTATION=-
MKIAVSSVALYACICAVNAFAPSSTTTQRNGGRNGDTSLDMGVVSTVNSAAKKLGVPPEALAVGAAAAVAGTVGVKLILDRPSRKYEDGSVAREYDAWTQDGILEYYWGEHIHLGYYTKEEMEAGYKKKDFIEAKYDFVDEMMKLGGIGADMGDSEAKVLDVGCGVGGTSRYLAKSLGPKADVTGITLSPNQVKRATELAEEQGVPNAKFTVMNALEMDFPDNTFDVVWACESGEHMPDKEAYINEMMRVLKPGGKFVMATWCQRDDREVPFSKKDERDLRFLYEEWTHPYFISIEKYAELIDATGLMNEVTTADWVDETIASWRHSVWVGIYDPRGFIFKPTKYLKCVRDAYCLERMHRAFKRGLMQYGMFAATKKAAPVAAAAEKAEKVESN